MKEMHEKTFRGLDDIKKKMVLVSERQNIVERLERGGDLHSGMNIRAGEKLLFLETLT